LKVSKPELSVNEKKEKIGIILEKYCRQRSDNLESSLRLFSQDPHKGRVKKEASLSRQIVGAEMIWELTITEGKKQKRRDHF